MPTIGDFLNQARVKAEKAVTTLIPTDFSGNEATLYVMEEEFSAETLGWSGGLTAYKEFIGKEWGTMKDKETDNLDTAFEAVQTLRESIREVHKTYTDLKNKFDLNRSILRTNCPVSEQEIAKEIDQFERNPQWRKSTGIEDSSMRLERMLQSHTQEILERFHKVEVGALAKKFPDEFRAYRDAMTTMETYSTSALETWEPALIAAKKAGNTFATQTGGTELSGSPYASGVRGDENLYDA